SSVEGSLKSGAGSPALGSRLSVVVTRARITVNNADSGVCGPPCDGPRGAVYGGALPVPCTGRLGRTAERRNHCLACGAGRGARGVRAVCGIDRRSLVGTPDPGDSVTRQPYSVRKNTWLRGGGARWPRCCARGPDCWIA